MLYQRDLHRLIAPGASQGIFFRFVSVVRALQLRSSEFAVNVTSVVSFRCVMCVAHTVNPHNLSE